MARRSLNNLYGRTHPFSLLHMEYWHFWYITGHQNTREPYPQLRTHPHPHARARTPSHPTCTHTGPHPPTHTHPHTHIHPQTHAQIHPCTHAHKMEQTEQQSGGRSVVVPRQAAHNKTFAMNRLSVTLGAWRILISNTDQSVAHACVRACAGGRAASHDTVVGRQAGHGGAPDIWSNPGVFESLPVRITLPATSSSRGCRMSPSGGSV